MVFSEKSISKAFGCKGFTAVELMVTVSIVAILAAIAIPSFTSLMAKYRLSNENTSLMLDFVLARGEAVSRSTRVTVCQSSDGLTCAAGGWATGRVTFVDRGAVGSVDAGDEILRVNTAIASGDTMSPSAANTFVSYDTTGVPSTNVTLTITTCKTGYTGAKVMIYPTGRVRADTSGVCL